jgi:cytochrome c biogenesis protein ResB
MTGPSEPQEASSGMSPPCSPAAFWAVLRSLASLRLALALLLFLLLFGIMLLLDRTMAGSWLALPLGLLAVNLLAAIVVHPAFRREPPLLAFHLALLALVLIAALGRLTYLSGQAEVTTGEYFDASLVISQQGLWHEDRLKSLNFRLDGFTIDYLPNRGMAQRDVTRARLRWFDRHGNEQQGIIGDHYPLLLGGYRFYTSHNKGFAPLFRWQPAAAPTQQGSIHLPAWPSHEYRQALDWTLPGTAHQLWTQLQFDEALLDGEHPSQFRTPREHLLVVRDGNKRYEMRPGMSIDLADGRLTYLELRTWMGFKIFYDWTLPWLLAAGVMAVLALGWHYWRKFSAMPWLAAQDDRNGAGSSAI